VSELDQPIPAIAAAVTGGEKSAAGLAVEALERIEREDGRIGAFLSTDAAGAAQRAQRVDREVSRGADPGRLAGVPVGIKDAFVTRGIATTCGSSILEGWIPPYDATAVQRLILAGAVPVGKTNLDEFCMGSSCESSAFGPTRNPHDPELVPGGSSGGSAAAVAAGMVPLALGSDSGGSVRQPASLCGVVGLKPGYGRVSRWGLIAFASSLDTPGVIARSTADCALALEAICGPDGKDATALDEPPPRLDAALRRGAEGMRLGIPADLVAGSSEDRVAVAFERAAATLEALGASIVEVELPHAELALPVYHAIADAEAASNLARYDGLRFGARRTGSTASETRVRTRELFGGEVRRRVMLGTYALAEGYAEDIYHKAQRARTEVSRDFERLLGCEVDLVISPTSPTPAFPLGSRADDPLEMYRADVFTLPASLAGLPAISVPCPTRDGGLPIGLQLIGARLDEAAVVAAAAAFEREARA
jgi:aspartyl-tRNA(Asn)/glutamyl-tRNA(Gln) amidotransferase subunit A